MKDMVTRGTPIGIGSFVTIWQGPGSDCGIGKLDSFGGKDAVVRFFDHPDDPDPPSILVSIANLRPARLQPQTRVYRLEARSSRWQVGRVLNEEGGLILVQFPQREIANFDATDLEIRWRKPIEDPLAFLVRQVTETPRFSEARSQFVSQVTRQRAASQGMSALLSSSIQLADYQYKVVKRVLQDPVQRYLLADEVGLGKTVEAGVLIRQFLLDDPRRARVVVVVPPALVDQWRTELTRRFHLGPWLDDTLQVIASDRLGDLATVLPAANMLVVDEAHHLSTHEDAAGRSLFDLVRESASGVDALLLLSATPALADSRGFLRMLHLLDPVVFPLEDIAGFRKRIDARQAVAEIVAGLVPENVLVMEDDLDRVLTVFGDDEVLQGHIDRLRPIIQALPQEDDEEFLDALEAVRIHIAETYRLHRRILRNRRRSFPWATPKRAGLRRVIYRSRDQRNRHIALEELRLQLVNQGDGEVASHALLRFAVQPTCPESLAEILRGLGVTATNHLASAARVDALSKEVAAREDRIRALVREVESLLRAVPLQVAVFCDHPETADDVFTALVSLLRSQAVRHHVHDANELEDLEGMPLAPDDWRRFLRQPEQCRILVCDRRAEEGLNLHGGRKVIIHFDLPLSPNRVEQRIGRFDRFGSGNAIESIALICEDDPDEIAWADCLDLGFDVFGHSLASLQYLVDEKMGPLPSDWFNRGTSALAEVTQALGGPFGAISFERRRIDQQDTLDSLGARPDETFDELEAVDGEWKAWGEAFFALAERTLQLGRASVQWKGALPPGEQVFRTRYSAGGSATTLFPLSVFISDFIGTLDTDAPEASSRNLVSFPYALRRHTALSKEGEERGVRPLRFGTPLVDALEAFSRHDDRGRVSAMWRYWPAYVASDASGHDLFFRFDFLVEAQAEGDTEADQISGDGYARALRRRLDGCFPPEFTTIWVGADGSTVENPPPQLTARYRGSRQLGPEGRDFNLNPIRWHRLALRDDLPWLLEWEATCRQAQALALDRVKDLPSVREKIRSSLRRMNEQFQAHCAGLRSRIDRLGGPARQAEEAELAAELVRHKCMQAAVAHPRFHLDVVSAVFVSPHTVFDA
jgi:ATP-dependent helicase HepA